MPCEHDWVIIYDTGTRYQVCKRCKRVKSEVGQCWLYAAIAAGCSVCPAILAWLITRPLGNVTAIIITAVTFLACFGLSLLALGLCASASRGNIE
jgi:hypothetical protein